MLHSWFNQPLPSCLALLALLSASSAHAEVKLDDFDGKVVVHEALEVDRSRIQAKCKQLEYYTSNAEDLKTCSGVDSSKLTASAKEFTLVASSYLWASEMEAVGACTPLPAGFTIPANADVPAAETALAGARANLAGLNASTTRDPAKVTAAEADVKAKEAALASAKESLAEFKQAQLPLISKKIDSAVEKIDAAFIVADGKERNAGDFQAIAEAAIAVPDDENKEKLKRSDACFAIYSKRLTSANTQVLEQATREAHEVDTLRKTSIASTIATLGSAAVEQPGSPDYVVYSLMTALGGDQQTSGDQLSVSLNLSSLFWPDAKTRLKQDVGFRNVFLRGTFPLKVTQGQTPAPTSDEAAAAAAPDSVRRFSLVLGGSFLDETDTRLDANRRCYEAALAYAGFASTDKEDESRLVERQTYFDVCSHLVVNRARVSWRAGVGLLSNQGDTQASTKPEMAAGVVVWAPTSQVYVNFLGQYFFRPTKVAVGGIGLSAAGNVGGGRSGASAWARVGVDLTALGAYDRDAREGTWELRLAPALRGRMFGDSVTCFEVGPRILSHGDTQLIATVTFGYDADRVMNQLLTPMPTKP